MSVAAATLVRRRQLLSGLDVRGAFGVAALLGFAALVGFLVNTHVTIAVLVALSPIALYLFMRPKTATVLVLVALPIMPDVIGNETSSLNVSAADLLTVVAVLGLVPFVLLDAEWRDRLSAATPALAWCAPFFVWLLVILPAHLTLHSVINTLQDVQIVIVSIVLGAVVLDRRHAAWALRGFLAMCCVLAVVWVAVGSTSSFAGQKNAAGQFLAFGILVLLVVRMRWQIKAALGLLLLIGLVFAASRGAIVGLAAGAIALLAVRGLGSWRRTAASVVVLVFAVLAVYHFAPARLQRSIQSIAHGGGATTTVVSSVSANQEFGSLEYNVKIRAQYRKDAFQIARDHPWLGVGVGNYHAGVGATETIDPHNVLLRDAAEGGLPDVVLFVVMYVGMFLLLVRRLGRSPWAGLAIALQVCLLAHGMLDVYWLRAVPVLPWVAVGMTFNPRLSRA